MEKSRTENLKISLLFFYKHYGKKIKLKGGLHLVTFQDVYEHNWNRLSQPQS